MEIIKNKHRDEKIFVHLNVVPFDYPVDFKQEKEFHC